MEIENLPDEQLICLNPHCTNFLSEPFNITYLTEQHHT